MGVLHFTPRSVAVLISLACICGFCLAVPGAFAQTAATSSADEESSHGLYLDPDAPIDKRVEDLIGRMTLEEKVSQMMNDAPAIDRLGIPAYNWWNECLHGVAAAGIATVFPQAIGLGATWDTELLFQVATVTSDEARAKHHEALRQGNRAIFTGLTFWSPNINIFRDPRWGRGQETYGEDPYLTARLGVEFVKGLQGDNPKYLKLVSTPKHYAVHSGPEPERYWFNAEVDKRNLYETYLPHFEACVREAQAGSVMCAYSAVNGEPCCSNPLLLEDILRGKWGFRGYVVSDCGAINNIYNDHKTVDTPEEAAARALLAGCDLNCGGTYSALIKAVEKGLATEKDIDRALTRLFTARFKLGMFDPPERVPYAQIPYSVVDCDEHRALALRTAQESIVLLKNEGDLLPLKKDLKTIAVIGPNAADAPVMYGNYNGTPSKAVTPLEGIRNAVSPDTEVIYVRGCDLEGFSAFEAIPSQYLRPSKAKDPEARGLRAEYYNNTKLRGEPVLTRVDASVNFDWGQNAPAPEVNPDDFSVRWRGKLVPPYTGYYMLGTSSDDGARLYLDGKPLVYDWTEHAVVTNRARVLLEAGREYNIQFDYYEHRIQAVARLVWAPPSFQERMTSEAYAVAHRADVCILVMGISNAMEGETHDRSYIDLPKPQQDLLRLIAATKKPVVLVLLSGSAVAVNWADENVPAIVEAWYPGEEGGTAIADVLFGNYNPAGRLPVTVYRSLDQVPAFRDYDVAAGRTYKYFDGEPLYPFGYGLSYTRFKYSNLAVLPAVVTPGDETKVYVTVTNTGDVAGEEVVQLYVTRVKDQGLRNAGGDPLVPCRELQGFRRIALEPGKSQEVEFTLKPKQFARMDVQGRLTVEPGKVMVTVGGGQPGAKQRSGGRMAEPLVDDFEVVGASKVLDE